MFKIFVGDYVLVDPLMMLFLDRYFMHFCNLCVLDRIDHVCFYFEICYFMKFVYSVLLDFFLVILLGCAIFLF